MPAYNFQRQFIAMVVNGKKPHTIRRRRKNPTKAGDVLMLYTGLRTKKAFKFAQSVCVKVEPVIIYPTIEKIMRGDDLMSEDEVVALAKADGFQSVAEFFGFFEKTYGEYELADFEIIHWDVDGMETWLPPMEVLYGKN